MSEVNLLFMGKKKKPLGDAEGQKKNGDRHKLKTTQLRLHPLLRRQLDVLAKRNVSKRSQEIVIAIRDHLAKNGLWPIPNSEDSHDE